MSIDDFVANKHLGLFCGDTWQRFVGLDQSDREIFTKRKAGDDKARFESLRCLAEQGQLTGQLAEFETEHPSDFSQLRTISATVVGGF